MAWSKLKYQPSNPNQNGEGGTVSQTWPSFIFRMRGGLPLKDTFRAGFAQARAYIEGDYFIRKQHAQAEAYILKTNQPAQAQARIRYYIGVTGATTGALATDVTVSKPSAAQENDLLVAWIGCNTGSGNINSVPSDWTEYPVSVPNAKVYYKAVGASEPANYTWGFATSSYVTGTINAYRGIDLTDPIYAVGTHGSGGSSSPAPAPIVSTDSVVGLELLLYSAQYRNNTGPTLTSPWEKTIGLNGGGGSGGMGTTSHVAFLPPDQVPYNPTYTGLTNDTFYSYHLVLHPTEITKPMARVAHRVIQTSTSSATSASVLLPDSARSGDTLIVSVQYEGQVGTVTSSGWTKIDERNTATGGHYAVFYKRINNISAEPSSYTFDFDATASWHAVTTAIGRDLNSNSNIVVTYAYEYYTYGASSQWPVPALTMSARSVLLFVVAANNRGDNNGPTYPTGWPSPYRSFSGGNVAGTSGFGYGVGAGYRNTADPPTFNITASEAQSSQNYSFHVALMEYITPTGVYAQAAAKMIGVVLNSAQATALIDSPIKVQWGQAQAFVIYTLWGHSQAQAQLNAFNVNQFAQAQAFFGEVHNGYSQAQGDILQIYFQVSQAQADIAYNYSQPAQAQSKINSFNWNEVGQSQALIYVVADGQITQNYIRVLYTTNPDGQITQNFVRVLYVPTTPDAQITQQFIRVILNRSTYVYAQVQAEIFETSTKVSAQAQAVIFQPNAFSQAQATILQNYNNVAQTQAYIILTQLVFAQGQAVILQTYNFWAQANADILSPITTRNAHAQANADILTTYVQVAQAQGIVLQTYQQFAQAEVSILQTYQDYSQALAQIFLTRQEFAQANSQIVGAAYNFAQAQARLIGWGWQFAQANADIFSSLHLSYAQANASICYLIFKDTFSRVQGAGDLGTPDIGPNYFDDSYYTTSYDYVTTDGSVATTAGTVDYDYTWAFVPLTHRNILLTVDFYVGFSAWASYSYLIARMAPADPVGYWRVDAGIYDNDGTNTEHRLDLRYTYDGDPGWRQDSTFTTAITLSDSTWYTMQLLVVGTTAYARVFERGTAEPSWQLSLTNVVEFDTSLFSFYQDIGETHTSQKFDNFLAFEVYSPTPHQYANVLADILKPDNNKSAQAQARILGRYGWAQARAWILKLNTNKSGLARPRIKVEGNNKSSQAQARMILYTAKQPAQGLALIVINNIESFGQALALIDSEIKVQSGNAASWIITTYNRFAQAMAMRAERYSGSGHIQAAIRSYPQEFAHVMGEIRTYYQRWAQASVVITTSTVQVYAQATVNIIEPKVANAQAKIIVFGWLQPAQVSAYITNPFGFAQTQAFIKKTNKYGLAQAKITSNLNINVRGQARAWILRTYEKSAQAQATIDSIGRQQHGQAGAKIATTRNNANVQAQIMVWNIKVAQTQATLKSSTNVFAQSKALIKAQLKVAQAQTHISVRSPQVAQAMAQIGAFKYGNAQAYIYTPIYLVKFNNYILPGYAQQETLTTTSKIVDHYAPPNSGSLSEYTGLENKIISLRMRVVADDYLAAKGQISRAGTILRSSPTWARLYIHNSDRHYLALGQSVKMENTADKSGKVVDYDIEWHAKPWLISDQTYTATGTGTITITRTLANGGWTPATVNVTGTNVTVSGYTEYGEFTGFISVSGYVANMVITSEPFGSSLSGRIKNPDYAMYIGPGTTYIVTTGATSCTVTYQDRWSL